LTLEETKKRKEKKRKKKEEEKFHDITFSSSFLRLSFPFILQVGKLNTRGFS